MLRRPLRYQILVILLLLQSGWIQAQTIRLQQSGNRHVLIGEPVSLTWQVILPATADTSSRMIWNNDSLGGVELLEQMPRQLVRLKDQQWMLQQQFRFVSFDSGRHAIAFPVLYPDTLPTKTPDSVFVEVRFHLGDSADQRIHDIHAVYDVPDTNLKTETLLIFLAGCVLIVVIWFLYRKRRKRTSFLPVEKTDPFDAICESLRNLEQEVQQNGFKSQHLVQLKQMLKQYLYEKGWTGIPAMVTADLLIACRKQGLDAGQLGKLASVLRMADAVQFARYQPDLSDWQNMLQYFRDCLQALHHAPLNPPLSEMQAHGI